MLFVQYHSIAFLALAITVNLMKFFQIVISIAVGMAAGAIPIVGYNQSLESCFLAVPLEYFFHLVLECTVFHFQL